MKNELKTNITHQNSIATIRLKGELTTLAENEIYNAYQSSINSGNKSIIFDFSEIEYINSAGIAVLIGLVNDSKKKDITLLISGLTPHFQKIFKMVGLTQYTKIFDEVKSAIASINSSKQI